MILKKEYHEHSFVIVQFRPLHECLFSVGFECFLQESFILSARLHHMSSFHSMLHQGGFEKYNYRCEDYSRKKLAELESWPLLKSTVHCYWFDVLYLRLAEMPQGTLGSKNCTYGRSIPGFGKRILSPLPWPCQTMVTACSEAALV